VSDKLKVLVAVLKEAQPILDALVRLHKDVGSVSADRLYANAPPEARMLCVALSEPEEVRHFMASLVVDLNMHDQLASHSHLLEIDLLPLPLGAVLVVFTDIACAEVPTP
jgi:hypothetical protein